MLGKINTSLDIVKKEVLTGTLGHSEQCTFYNLVQLPKEQLHSEICIQKEAGPKSDQITHAFDNLDPSRISPILSY